MSDGYRDLFVSARDGLRLYARDYGNPINSGALPVVCLPGLARNSSDFHDLASALAMDPKRPRRVLALDYRGRGRSEWDDNWRNYDPRVEADDTLQVLTAAGIEKAIFVGTSRGGLITMGLAAFRPAMLRGVVLNDIGPAIDAEGLVRIRGYVGKLPSPHDFREAGEILRQLSDAQFPRLTTEQWQTMARGTWREESGRLVLAYDAKLTKLLESIDLEAPLPEIWPLFEGLKHLPLLVLRGANSDLLSAATLARMQQIHPQLQAITVPDQGHAPLIEGDLTERVRRFIAQAEAAPRAHRASMQSKRPKRQHP